MSYQKMYILLASDEVASSVAIYLPSISKPISTNRRANWNYSEVVPPDLSKLNHSVMNKKQGQMG